MPKPLVLPTWASSKTNNDPPSTLQRQTGWVPGQDGISDYDNWFKDYTAEWLAYLNTGAFDGDVSITGNLSATGNATITGNATVAGFAHTAEFRQSKPIPFYLVPGAGGVTVSNGPGVGVAVLVGNQVNFHTHGQRVGDRIKAVKITAQGTASTIAPTGNMQRFDAYGVLVAVPHSAILTSGANNANAEYTFTPTTPVTLAEGQGLVISLTPNGAGQSYLNMTVVYDHPVV